MQSDECNNASEAKLFLFYVILFTPPHESSTMKETSRLIILFRFEVVRVALGEITPKAYRLKSEDDAWSQ